MLIKDGRTFFRALSIWVQTPLSLSASGRILIFKVEILTGACSLAQKIAREKKKALETEMQTLKIELAKATSAYDTWSKVNCNLFLSIASSDCSFRSTTRSSRGLGSKKTKKQWQMLKTK